uniref:Transmembrane protein n=1 Tax=Clytia hemisphaerica TaxID=252671 RepID=A0A7M5WRS2_9CNID
MQEEEGDAINCKQKKKRAATHRLPIFPQSKKIQEIIEKWNQTNFEPYTTPILNMIEKYPVGSLFLLIFGVIISIPLILCLVFIISTLVMTICGSFIVFGTFTSIALVSVGAIAFFAALVSIALTAACLVGYNISTGVQEFLTP